MIHLWVFLPHCCRRGRSLALPAINAAAFTDGAGASSGGRFRPLSKSVNVSEPTGGLCVDQQMHSALPIQSTAKTSARQ